MTPTIKTNPEEITIEQLLSNDSIDRAIKAEPITKRCEPAAEPEKAAKLDCGIMPYRLSGATKAIHGLDILINQHPDLAVTEEGLFSLYEHTMDAIADLKLLPEAIERKQRAKGYAHTSIRRA